MNTRLQVEHPVTEMITGVDLVEWQLRVAAGEPLPQAAGRARASRSRDRGAHLRRGPGRAASCRRSGRSCTCARRRRGRSVRVDTGVRAGDEISPYYDPMIAKLVVHGEDRPAALRRLAEALAEYEIVGVATNVAFLQRVVAHEAFASGDVDTGLIARHHDALFPAAAPVAGDALLAAALGRGAARSSRRAPRRRARPAIRIRRGTRSIRGGRTARATRSSFAFADGESRHDVALRRAGDGWRVDAARRRDARRASTARDGRLGHRRRRRRSSSRRWCRTARSATSSAHGDASPAAAGRSAGPRRRGGGARRPPDGADVRHRRRGDGAGRATGSRKGAPLMILEAMKMEHTIVAPAAGVVTAVNFRVGDRVDGRRGPRRHRRRSSGAGARLLIPLPSP